VSCQDRAILGKPCTVDGCPENYSAKGYCKSHYNRWYRYGDPIKEHSTSGGVDDSIGLWGLRNRFLDQVAFEPMSGCWLWVGHINADGYGSIRVQKVLYQVHRYAYTILVGEVPEGLELDHTCQVRCCVNPAHLKPVTSAENKRLAGVRRKYCPNGHEYTVDNTSYTGGYRRCKLCQNNAAKAYYRRKYKGD
jgi:hypothetical protein